MAILREREVHVQAAMSAAGCGWARRQAGAGDPPRAGSGLQGRRWPGASSTCHAIPHGVQRAKSRFHRRKDLPIR